MAERRERNEFNIQIGGYMLELINEIGHREKTGKSIIPDGS